ncbi:ABC transporter ATP-binding protein [Peptostreptococcus canis]|uniref:ABC transporter ATP-binding protein n=1 Tax=Peptostreptococcus canis TaxID=1159213 RepID=A0ABR6TIP5_9FIRM|nr:ABC transporter ATP-binding protein [Peptostreptococcus canis]MBC2575270.1 ABC transporter ATP-binding protein [Peptostreptococcus canis]MBP1997547.1 putative ABC transport system ATP-binding protein [Peptostreptococcus canis]
MGNSIFEIVNMCKDYNDNEILKNISFKIQKGEFISVMGRSGCGKSTLLYCISGMDRPTFGNVIFDGNDMINLNDNDMEKLRLKHMGFIFQKATFLKNLPIIDNIIFPAFQLGKQGRKEILGNAKELMKRLDIFGVAENDIREVSGGQLQRAAICRAMINQPDILFGDEPTGALNSAATQEVMEVMTEINKRGTTILIVTHDAKVAVRADRIIYLEDGQIKEILSLGKYTENDEDIRSEKMREWLNKMNF